MVNSQAEQEETKFAKPVDQKELEKQKKLQKDVYKRQPWESFDKAGDPDSFEFAIPSPTAQEMLAFCGGSVSGLALIHI